MRLRFVALGCLSSVLFLGCGRSAGQPDPEVSSRLQAAASSQRSADHELLIRIHGQVFDIKGDPPSVPAELDVYDAPASGIVEVPAVEPGEAGPVEVKEPPGAQRPPKLLKWIVQFDGPVHAGEKRAVADLGATFGDYVPEFAFVVSMDRETADKVALLPSIHGVARLKPAYKVHSKLKDSTGAIAKEKDDVQLLVRVDIRESLPTVLAGVRKHAGSILAVAKDVARVKLSASEIAKLARDESVLWVEEAPEVRLVNDTSSWTIQSYVEGERRIWDRGLRGEGQIVGIGDTGLDHDMCFFRDPAGTPIGPAHRKVVGYASLADDYDGNMGHGTHVAGSVAGNQAPVDGSSASSGMAPAAKLFMTDLTPGELNTVTLPADLGDLFATPYLAGARLHSDSWGADTSVYDAYAWSADRFMWEHKDFLALFANGNAGPSDGSVGTPAVAKNVVSVGATGNGTTAEAMAAFSSHGPTLDGRTKPTLSAPGVSILSADSDGVRGSLNCGTIAFSGTSMATPTTAGAAALIRQYFAEGWWPYGSPSPARGFSPSAALVKAVLVNSAQAMSGEYIAGPIPATGQGWGRINLGNTLHFAGDSTFLEVVEGSALETGGSWSKSFFSSGARAFKVTLVWTDYPSGQIADGTLVNDLDLSVVAPDGTLYLGNAFAGGVSVTGGAPDRVNVEEQVLVTAQQHGRYTVTVNAYNAPYGPQPFALVVSGAAGVSSKGFIGFDKGRYGGNDAIRVEVSDLDLDVDPATADEAFVIVRTSRDEERLRVVESAPDTGIFTGTLVTGTAAPVAGDGRLDVAEGDAILGEYVDANDGAGSTVVVHATATADLVLPVIGGTAVSGVGQDSATITWSTNEPTDAVVEYGETRGLGVEQAVSSLGTSHSVQLHRLKEATTYYFAVRSSDEARNGARDDNLGALYTFTTATLPPELSAYSSNSTETYWPETVIMGTATDPSGIASIAINGEPATYRATDGYFERSFQLAIGDNPFDVVAVDGLGNGRTVRIVVKRLALPDLVVTSVVGPASGGVGEPIHVDETVCNIGAGPSPGTGRIGWFLSADEQVSPEGDLGFPNALIAYDEILPGECIELSVDPRTPMVASTVGNTYFLGSYVDCAGEVWEADDANNGKVGGPITILGPDLTVAAVSAPTTVLTETAFEAPTRFSNLGPGGAWGFAMGVFLSSDTGVTTQDLLLSTARTGSLWAGQSYDALFTVRVPSTTRPGAYYIGAIADTGNEVVENDESNNAIAGNAVTVVGPDLYVTSVAGPAAARTGDPVTITTAIAARQGLGGAAAFHVGLYLSRDASITTADARIGSFWVAGPLAPGATSTTSTTLTLPRTIADGAWYFGAIVDDQSEAMETDEANNALAGNVVTVGGPDVVMETVTGPSVVSPGGTIAVTSSVRASAAGAEASDFYVGIFLSTDQAITTGDRLVGSRRVAGLAAGATSTVTADLRLPGDLPVGTYHLGAIADNFSVFDCDPYTDVCAWYTDQVKETDETNNVAIGNTIFVGDRPDLAITAVSAPSSGAPGGVIAVDCTIANVGNVATPASQAALYLSSDATITTADVLLWRWALDPIGAGASNAATFAVTLPAGLAAGTYYLGAIADPDGTVAEGSEANNVLAASGTLTITVGLPDLVVTAVTNPGSATAGRAISVSTTVTNGGAMTAAAADVGIYLSTDTTITTADLLLGTRSLGALSPGATSTGKSNVTVPANLKGTYYVGAIVDPSNRLLETNEANNWKSGARMTIKAGK